MTAVQLGVKIAVEENVTGEYADKVWAGTYLRDSGCYVLLRETTSTFLSKVSAAVVGASKLTEAWRKRTLSGTW
jgi:hypothetical protein